LRDLLLQCFQKDPNLRVSATKLLQHPWILAYSRISEKKSDLVIDENLINVGDNSHIKSKQKDMMIIPEHCMLHRVLQVMGLRV